jgi:hypothetical protein
MRTARFTSQLLWALTAGLALALNAAADNSPAAPVPPKGAPERAPDKSAYNLFNPTPRALMRELTTDRPDKTESPYTVDAGHFQIEMDLASYTHDRDTANRADLKADSLAVAALNLKAGLLNQVELQLMVDTYTWVRVQDRGAVARQSGFGDLTTRLKINCWGNDGGTTALALMPFVKFPTSQHDLGNHAVEGGLIVPLAVELPLGWGMGLMTEFDVMQDADGTGRHSEFINSVTFSHDIVGRLSGYLEFYSQVIARHEVPWIGTADFGLTYRLTEDLQLDAGVSLGVTRPAADVNPFLGLSLRF